MLWLVDNMVQFNIILVWFYCSRYIEAYRNRLYTIANLDDSKTREYKCAVYEGFNMEEGSDLRDAHVSSTSSDSINDIVENPYEVFQSCLHKFLFGVGVEMEDEHSSANKLKNLENNNTDSIRYYVIGNYSYAELFNNKSGVHLPQMEYMYRGHCSLFLTRDYMQTAVNAFAIFLYGTIEDIKQLPADYVLRSSRTISMMKIAREKLVTTWDVVKDQRNTEEISYETLEMYRPLFKYINGREIAKLNLSDERILTYIGTHAELDRHQVGMVASKYIELNPQWSEPKFLNRMNNLLCGVPMTFMRKLPENKYLQLSRQVFYHIRACEPLQKRFFLSMMTRTQVRPTISEIFLLPYVLYFINQCALGKSYSWNARDVSRLGILLAEVDGEDLSLIKPEAMAGIASQVMQHIPVENLKYLTLIQQEYLTRKALNIFIRKLKIYEDELQLYGVAFKEKSNFFVDTMILMMIFVIN